MIRAEALKLLGLLGVRVTVALAVVLPPVMTMLTSRQIQGNLDSGRPGAFIDTRDLAYGELMFLVPCAIVIGVLAVSSEYRINSATPAASRQIGTTLLAQPFPWVVVLVKAGVVAVLTALTAALALALSGGVAHLVLGEFDWGPRPTVRILAAVGFWVSIALLASGVTWVTRSGLIPLVVLILNSSLLSLTYLLSQVTDLVRFLPDAAAIGVVLTTAPLEPQSPLAVGVILASWPIAALLIGGLALTRRDA